MSTKALILFDGVCNFCNSSVNFIIDHDPQDYFRFAPLQSDVGQAELLRLGLPTQDFDSLILIENGQAYTRSTAALKIASHLQGLWSWSRVLLLVPTFVRDPFYRIIAKNRYRWFGKSDQCRMPTPAYRARFLAVSAAEN
jgi:predicted DCC family thiol-disulfide oxidoreductase YuxK